MKIQNIYLAGKISKNDWRGPIIQDATYAGFSLSHKRALSRDWPVEENAILEKYNYVGPYFVSCDHGCYHGNNQHGIGIEKVCYEEENYVEAEVPPQAITTEWQRRQKVADLCLHAIDKADLVFAWLPDTTAHGTLVEIGYAKAKGKQVWIASPTFLWDLWFAYEMADNFLTGEPDPQEALQKMLEERSTTLRKAPRHF